MNFALCLSFKDYRELAFKQAEEMTLFERMFIGDGQAVRKRSGAPDGEWPALSEYKESDFNSIPDEYPIIIYGQCKEEYDRLSGAIKIWTWDWTTVSKLKADIF